MILTANRMFSTANKNKGSAKDASRVMDPLVKKVIRDALFDDRSKERFK